MYLLIWKLNTILKSPEKMTNVLLQIPNLVKGYVMKRPSKHIKSPYVADVVLCDSNTEIIAHTAALGCCGLADMGAQVLMTVTPEAKSGNKTQKCSHRIYLSILNYQTIDHYLKKNVFYI